MNFIPRRLSKFSLNIFSGKNVIIRASNRITIDQPHKKPGFIFYSLYTFPWVRDILYV